VLRTRASAERALLARLSSLLEETRHALLVAALARVNDLGTVERALEAFGSSSAALVPAAEEGLVTISDGNLTFSHGLVRSTIAYGALRSDRRSAHAALAGALPSDTAQEAFAWHQALAAPSPDEEVASALEEAAVRARDRGALVSSARAYELSARLTPAATTRAQRLVQAAEVASLAGHVYAAIEHLEAAVPDLEDPIERARCERLLGRVLARSGSAARARDTLLVAAERCEADDPAQAAAVLAEAVIPALRAGEPVKAREIGRRALALAEDRGGGPELSAAVMLGIALVFTGAFREGRQLILRADGLAGPAHALVPGRQLRAYLGAALRLAGEHVQAGRVLTELADEARAEGAVGTLAYTLVRLGDVDLDAGRWATARALLAEAVRLARETGQGADRGLAAGGLAWLGAAQGRDRECRERAADAISLADRLGIGSKLNRAAHALGLLALGRGEFDEAASHLSELRRLQNEQGWCHAAVQPHVAADLIEALGRAGRFDDARRELASFEEEAKRAGRPSSLAALARCRGLLEQGDDALSRFEEALTFTEEDTGPFERARAQLAYGEFLAGAGRVVEGAGALHSAFDRFAPLGAGPWEAQTREALSRLGQEIPERDAGPAARLTERELQVALAVASHESPDDAAARLLLTVPTVEYNLASALAKLGLSSPAELAKALGDDSVATAAG
jgi:tetratricopeptide (TPR) repeat protein